MSLEVRVSELNKSRKVLEDRYRLLGIENKYIKISDNIVYYYKDNTYSVENYRGDKAVTLDYEGAECTELYVNTKRINITNSEFVRVWGDFLSHEYHFDCKYISEYNRAFKILHTIYRSVNIYIPNYNDIQIYNFVLYHIKEDFTANIYDEETGELLCSYCCNNYTSLHNQCLIRTPRATGIEIMDNVQHVLSVDKRKFLRKYGIHLIKKGRKVENDELCLADIYGAITIVELERGSSLDNIYVLK